MQPNPPIKAATEVEKLEHKKKGQVGDVNECANCGIQATSLSKCSRCKLTSYCCQACQRQHWSAVGGHKKFCVSANQRSPDLVFSVDAQNEVKCAICQEMLLKLDQTVLPCLHAFHSRCIANLRESDVVQVCPICRSSISEVDTEENFQVAEVHYMNIARSVDRSECSWGTLTSGQRKEMDETIRLLLKAADHGHVKAQLVLGDIYKKGHGVMLKLTEAFRWYDKAANQGDADTWATCTLRAEV